MPEVSVVIPAYNGEEYIEQAIACVFEQTFRDFELVVVNDGSTDRTPEILAGYGDRLRVLTQENRGLSATRNFGIRETESPLLAFLDVDDLWHPTKLERQVAFARAHPEAGVITTDVEWFDETGIIQGSLRGKYPIVDGDALESLLFHNWIAASAVMVRRECFDEVGGFDEERGILGEDWMMWVRIAGRYPIRFIPEVLTSRRVLSDSLGHRDLEYQFENLFRNLEKLQAQVPQLRERPELVREAAFRICLNRGTSDLYKLDLPRAREKLRRALGYRPGHPRARALLAVSFLPAPVLRALRGSLRALRGQGSSPPA